MPPATSTGLKHELCASEFFTLSFGAIIGVGWIVALGNWVSTAGSIGAIVAFAFGGFMTLLVGFCYAELGALFPFCGGEIAFAYESFGIRTCFAVGWLLLLTYIATAVFEAISVGWIVATLFPYTKGPVLYTVRNSAVHLGSVLLGFTGMAIVTLLNYKGIKPAARLQDALTYAKLALVLAVGFVALAYGRIENLHPSFRGGTSRSAWAGVFAIFMTTPFWLSGFNTVCQVMEEKSRRTSLKRISRIILLSIGLATLFYCSIIFFCAMMLPSEDLVKLDLPAASAFKVALHSSLPFRVILAIGLIGNLTVWNSMFIAGSRILFALGRAHIVWRGFADISNTGIPDKAVLFVGVLGCAGVFLGRSGILPLINLASICTVLPYLVVSAAVVKMRRQRPDEPRPYRVPGGAVTAMLAVFASMFIIFLSLYEPYLDANRHPPFEWWLLAIWAALGASFWIVAENKRNELNETERRKVFRTAALESK
jgi:APA family basic amino acid/polyamine antiporter